MRVLMIYPENQVAGTKPAGAALLSAILKQKGHAVDFIDTSQYDQSAFFDRPIREGKFSYKKPNYLKMPKKIPLKPNGYMAAVDEWIRIRIDRFKPDIILVSAATIAFYHARRILSKIEISVPVIYGGYHTIGNSESAIAYPDIRGICVGEGEKSLPELLAKMEEGRYYYDTPNFFFKDEAGKIIRNPRLPLEDNLDELPFVDYSIFDYTYHFNRVFRGKYFRMGDIVHSRGCLNSCSFCFYDQYYKLFNQTRHVIRAYSPKRAVEEIAWLVKNYDLNFIRFHSSDFLALNEDYISEFSRIYRKRISLPNVINASVRTVTKSKARLLRRMNCISVTLGVESGNEEYRKKVLSKHFTNEELIKKVAFLRSEGIRVTSNNMVFLPQESREMIFENIRLHKKAKIETLDYDPFFPFPGLTITKYCIEKGLLKDDLSFLVGAVFRSGSVLKGPIGEKEQIGLIRTIYFYKEFPEIVWGLVRLAEKDTRLGMILHNILHRLYHGYKYGLDLESKNIWLRRKLKNFTDPEKIGGLIRYGQ